jgi:Domain of unknown function (DUF4160)
MPVVLRWCGYRFFFYSEEGNEPPHIHVFKSGNETKIWLKAATVADNRGFSRHELNTLCRFVDEHKDMLCEVGNEYFAC